MTLRVTTVVTAVLLALLTVAVAARVSSARTADSTWENPAAGGAKTENEARKAVEQEKQAKVFERAVLIMEQHMKVSADGSLELNETALQTDIENGAARGIDRKIFEDLKGSLAQTNSDIRLGKVKATTVFPVASVEASNTSAEQDNLMERSNSFAAAQRYCSGRGRTAFYTFWWGYRYYYSDCLTHRITDALKGGSGLGFLCAYAGAWAVPCGTVTGIGAFSAFAIDYIDRRGGHDGVVHVNPYGPGFYLRAQ